jgi:hypothetical protein
VVLLDERDGLVVHQRVDDVVQGVGDDLADRVDRPAGDHLGEELAHLLHLVVVGAAHEEDELGVGAAQHVPAVDEAAGVEGATERQRARLGDDRLVQVEERRGSATGSPSRPAARAWLVAGLRVNACRHWSSLLSRCQQGGTRR